MLRITLHTGYQCCLYASLPATSTQDHHWIRQKKSMSDNIRKKAIFENKIAKIAQNLPKFDIFAYFTLTLHNVNVFANTTNNSGVSIYYSYRDLA